MADPQTGNIGLAVPTRGSDAGTWDVPVNNDMTAIDGIFGGVQSFSLSSATTATLTAPAGFTATPAAGPVQSQNAILRFTGALSGNALYTLPAPGYYIIDNRTTGSSNYVQLRAVGSGEIIATPQGTPVKIFNDGTNVRFVNLPLIGSFMDLCGVTAVPAWIGACTVPPWLLCDGSVYSIATYPFLGPQLGATFGGNGSTTYAVPDLRGRWRVALDPAGNFITSATMTPNGNTLAATGGAQNETIAAGNVPALAFAGTQQTWLTQQPNVLFGLSTGASSGGSVQVPSGTQGTASVIVTPAGTVNTGSANTALTTLPPVLVTGITLIRAG